MTVRVSELEGTSAIVPPCPYSDTNTYHDPRNFHVRPTLVIDDLSDVQYLFSSRTIRRKDVLGAVKVFGLLLRIEDGRVDDGQLQRPDC